MTRFDDLPARGPSLVTDAVRLVRNDPFVYCVAIAGAAVASALFALTLVLVADVGARWSALSTSTRITVFLDPRMPRQDAERLKLGIDAIPFVGSSVLRTREDALAGLPADVLPSLQNRPNVLPDVWLVSLRPPGSDPKETQRGRVDRLKAALAALPGVESVQADARWIDWIDRWSTTVRTGIVAVDVLAFALAILACFAFFFLAGRASTAAVRSRWIAAAAGFAAGAVVAGIAVALLWATIGDGGVLASVLQPIRVPAGLDPLAAAAPLLCASVAACAIGLAFGVRRDLSSVSQNH